MRLFTIGFTKKSARDFFGKLHQAGVKRVVDIRLNNVSQLAGFAKKDDLQYFLEREGIEYVHLLELAPTQTILDELKKKKGSWEQYENSFLELMRARKVDETVPKSMLENGCLLCSEDKPLHCHRRLVAEYLANLWDGVEIIHIV
jgi:uncharacterized protein (DUF488 family)